MPQLIAISEPPEQLPTSPFSFDAVYALTCRTGNFFPRDLIQIALGVRGLPGEGHQVVEFLNTSPVNGAHSIKGRIRQPTKHVIEVFDLGREGDDGKPIVWRFEPFTLRLWRKMGRAGSIDGYAEMKSWFSTDEALQRWYISNFRYPWWKPIPDNNVSM